MKFGFWRGKIVAIFHRSLNVEMEGGFLIHVGEDRLPLTSRSVLLPKEDFYRLLLPRAFLGQPVTIADGSMYVGDIQLNFSHAETHIFDPQIHLLQELLAHPIVFKNLVTAFHVVEEVREEREERSFSPFANYFLSQIAFFDDPKLDKAEIPGSLPGGADLSIQMKNALWERVDFFLQALSQEAWDEVRGCIRKIIGLGLGLTPSGDDFLAGFISVGVILGKPWPNFRECTQKLAKIIMEEAAGRTTSVSVAMLADAANGEVAEPVSHFLRSILETGDEEGIRSFAAEICRMGAASGEDLLNGLATGIFFFQKMASSKQRDHALLEDTRMIQMGPSRYEVSLRKI